MESFIERQKKMLTTKRSTNTTLFFVSCDYFLFVTYYYQQ